MSFQNPILGGETLIRSGIKSENFVTGFSGWRIGTDGTAEFTGLIARGGVATRGGYRYADTGIYVPVTPGDITSAHYDNGNQQGMYWTDVAGNIIAYVERRTDGTLMIYNEKGGNVVISTGVGGALSVTGNDSTGGNIFATGRLQGRVPTISLVNKIGGRIPSVPANSWTWVNTANCFELIPVKTPDPTVMTYNNAGMITIKQSGLYSITYSVTYGASGSAGSRAIQLFNNGSSQVPNVPESYGAIQIVGQNDGANWNSLSGSVVKGLNANDDVALQLYTSVAGLTVVNASLSVSFLGWANVASVAVPPSLPPLPPVLPGTSAIYTYLAGDAASWRGNAWDGGNVKQGDYGGNGNNTGYYLFETSVMRADLAGRTIDKVEIYVVRDTQGGNGAAGLLYLCDHNIRNFTGSGGSRVTDYGTWGSWAWGSKGWMTVPNTIAEHIRDNLAAGWGIFTPTGSPYMIFLSPQSTGASGMMRITSH